MKARPPIATRGFTMLEAMVVLAMMAIVTGVATSTFVALMRNTNTGRFALQAMQSTRTTLDVALEYGRRAGGADLPGHARILIDKSGGQRNTDVVWLIEQASGYGVCAVQSVAGSTVRLPVVTINGALNCCFEAGPEPPGTPPLADPVPPGAPFRRTAVIFDDAGRFLPVFLEGAPDTADCSVQMKPLPGISRVVSAAIGNAPAFTNATVVLADVRRLYVDFDADAVTPPYGALFSQVEVDGDVNSFVGERQRLSSNAIDLRAAVGYDATVPADEPDETEIDEEDDTDPPDPDDDELAPGGAPLLEMLDDARGWRVAPLPVLVATPIAPPAMLGVAVATGGRGEAFVPPSLPWSTRPLVLPRPANVFPLVGRVQFRDGARR